MLRLKVIKRTETLTGTFSDRLFFFLNTIWMAWEKKTHTQKIQPTWL